MAERMQPRHGLEAVPAAGLRPGSSAGPNVRILPDRNCINLRGDPDEPRFAAAVAEVLGQDLPRTPNTTTRGPHLTCWLGPDEWLIVTGDEAPPLCDALRAAFDGRHAAVTDLSGGYVGLRLTGAGVEEVLARGCTLDFHASAFPPGRCAQSGLAKAGALFVRDDEGFELYLRRSFAEYIVLWLSRVGEAHGLGFAG